MDIKTWSLYIMAGLYFLAGVNHFIMPKFYKSIIPPYLPFHDAINIISGLAEIVLAVMLIIPQFKIWGAWGIIALLIAVFPANVYHYQKTKIMWIAYIRLPLQAVFIYWAWTHTY